MKTTPNKDQPAKDQSAKKSKDSALDIII